MDQKKKEEVQKHLLKSKEQAADIERLRQEKQTLMDQALQRDKELTSWKEQNKILMSSVSSKLTPDDPVFLLLDRFGGEFLRSPSVLRYVTAPFSAFPYSCH